MNDQEIAKEILLKLIENKILVYNPLEPDNEKNLKTICGAYLTVFQTVSKTHNN